MKFAAPLLAAVLSYGLASATPLSSFEHGLYARDAYPVAIEDHISNLVEARDLELQRRNLEIRDVLEQLLARDADAGANPAKVSWSDSKAYKNDKATKAKWEGHACNALDRAGCASGTIVGTAHKSPPGGDQKEHITVKQPDGKKIHVHDDGKATKMGKDGKPIHFRRDLLEDDLFAW